ncbi:MAG: peptidoglycan DD-metalloendopeptidase family protein [Janthinobacterium lividum]
MSKRIILGFLSSLLITLIVCAYVFYNFNTFFPSKIETQSSDSPLSTTSDIDTNNKKEETIESAEDDKSIYEITLKIQKGDTLLSLLTGAKIDKNEAHEIIDILKKHFNPKDLKLHHEIYVTFVPDETHPAKKVFESLYFRPSIDKEFWINRTSDKKLLFEKHDVKLNRVIRETRGLIKDSLYSDARKEGVPVKILHKMIQAYGYDVDFQRSFQPGDSYGLLYDMRADEKGLKEEPGELLYATLTLKNKKLHLYFFKNKGESGEFYNQHGESIKKGLLRTPIDGARISSGFGNRKHPILGYTKAHKGIDFAAPIGTPIMASGDGTVVQVGPYANYGNYIKIKHNGEFSTAYAHLSRIVKGLNVGKSVKQGQIIGYVGMTGATTGPHLHYELIRGQVQINPASVKMVPAGKLGGKDLQAFKNLKNLVDQQYSQIYLDKVQQAEQQAKMDNQQEPEDENAYEEDSYDFETDLPLNSDV